MVLEGNELAGNIGDVGSYTVDLTSQGMLKATMVIEIDLVAEAEKLAAKTGTPIDDKAIAWLKMLMGRTA
jgi:hypothetical protein